MALPANLIFTLSPAGSWNTLSPAREADPSMALEGDVDLTIRPAQSDEATVLAQLMFELGYETTESEMQMRVERIATDERYHTFVAVRGGKVCGMIGTFVHHSYEHNDMSG